MINCNTFGMGSLNLFFFLVFVKKENLLIDDADDDNIRRGEK